MTDPSMSEAIRTTLPNGDYPEVDGLRRRSLLYLMVLTIFTATRISAAFGIGGSPEEPTSFVPSHTMSVIPADKSAFTIATTNEPSVPFTWTPNANPPSGINDALASSTVRPASCKQATICCPRMAASPSIAYETTRTFRPANGFQASAIAFCLSKLKLRGATAASNLILSNRSASAFWFASAARASALAVSK